MSSNPNGTSGPDPVDASPRVDTEFLIVGTGPAGAALACFLGSYGLKGIMIGMASGSADTPRAHITNMAALECLRDIGLEQDCLELATTNENMLHTRWCHSMAGQEYARIYSWGNDPARKGDYDAASPCSPMDLPQTLLEPILVRYATLHGFQCRFDTEFVSFEQKDGIIEATISDNLSKLTYTIRTKYLFGADGARSKIIKQLDIPLIVKPGQGLAINVLVKADLSHLVKHRMGNLHWMMQPDVDLPDFGWSALVRMVKPWHEWMFILFPSPNAPSGSQFRPSREEYLGTVRAFIGDSTPAEILGVSKWYINEIVAETYQKDNVFCLGDAVHRHPPFNGLGSNTCIQDAFNLAWKLAYVAKGWASPSLLTTYSPERQPVGKSIITRANDGFREHFNVWSALGMMNPGPTLRPRDERIAAFAELSADSEAGRGRRAALSEAILQTSHEFHGLGIEMNQHYASTAVFEADEPEREEVASLTNDTILYHVRSTYPGRRLPHVWLGTAIPSGLTSTIDLAGRGAFTLLTGIGGSAWIAAAKTLSDSTGIPIHAHGIGFGQEFEDAYLEWARIRGVEDSGCILVRPDRFVAWRAKRADGDEEGRLRRVFSSIMGRDV